MSHRPHHRLAHIWKGSLCALSILAGLGCAPGTGWAGSLTVEVKGIRNAQGTIIALLYDEPQAFSAQDWTRAAASVQLRAREGSARFTLHDLDPKPYAVVVLHDENGNNDLDMSGDIPTEGYAFSREAGRDAAPSFEEASFAVTSEDTTVSTRLLYLQH